MPIHTHSIPEAPATTGAAVTPIAFARTIAAAYRRAGVQQHLHPVARQQLAASGVAITGHLAATFGDFRELHPQVIDHGAHGRGVGLKVGGSGVEFAFQNGHVHPLVVALHHGARVQA